MHESYQPPPKVCAWIAWALIGTATTLTYGFAVASALGDENQPAARDQKTLRANIVFILADEKYPCCCENTANHQENSALFEKTGKFQIVDNHVELPRIQSG